MIVGITFQNMNIEAALFGSLKFLMAYKFITQSAWNIRLFRSFVKCNANAFVDFIVL